MHREECMRVRVTLEEIFWRMETLLWFDDAEITIQELRISLEDARRVLGTLAEPASTAPVIPAPAIPEQVVTRSDIPLPLSASETGGSTVVFPHTPSAIRGTEAYVTTQQCLPQK